MLTYIYLNVDKCWLISSMPQQRSNLHILLNCAVLPDYSMVVCRSHDTAGSLANGVFISRATGNPDPLAYLSLVCSTGPSVVLCRTSDSWNIPTQTQLMCSPQTDQTLTCSCYTKAKQPESGDLYGNITPSEVILPLQYTKRRLFCFYILLFNGFQSFQAEINMYLLLYFIFFKHSIGIHPTATQKSHEQHSNAIHVMSWWLMMS